MTILSSMRTHSESEFNQQSYERFKSLVKTDTSKNQLASALLVCALTFADNKKYDLAQEAGTLAAETVESSNLENESRQASSELYCRIADFFHNYKILRQCKISL